MTEHSCSFQSRQAQESLRGTAPLVENWFLLEMEGPYGRDVLQEGKLDDSVKAYLGNLLARHANSKLLLIRNSETNAHEKIRFIVGLQPRPNSLPEFSEFSLASYEDLLNVDLSRQQNNSNRRMQPTVLVCTNGRRDACCALYGVPLARRFSPLAGLRVFECSHVGQHRFAPNLIAFPDCIYYGRVALDAVEDLAAHLQNGSLYLPALRGRTIYPPPAQFAEAHLRENNVPENTPVMLIDSQSLDKDIWHVTFQVGSETHTLAVRYRENTGVFIRSSCEGEKTHHPGEYEILEHATSGP
ncbi:MAG: hypothetical protein HYZ26_07075 [Chloroflexi bacterium]|nr:hypothetical protein [Chloroflexota bacterium]